MPRKMSDFNATILRNDFFYEWKIISYTYFIAGVTTEFIFIEGMVAYDT